MQDALSEEWRDGASSSKGYSGPLLSWRVQRCPWSYHVTNSLDLSLDLLDLLDSLYREFFHFREIFCDDEMLNQLEQALELRLRSDFHSLIRSSSFEQIQIAKTLEKWNFQMFLFFWFDFSMRCLGFSLRLIFLLIVQHLSFEHAKEN